MQPSTAVAQEQEVVPTRAAALDRAIVADIRAGGWYPDQTQCGDDSRCKDDLLHGSEGNDLLLPPAGNWKTAFAIPFRTSNSRSHNGL